MNKKGTEMTENCTHWYFSQGHVCGKIATGKTQEGNPRCDTHLAPQMPETMRTLGSARRYDLNSITKRRS
jgi:hypothetical protein